MVNKVGVSIAQGLDVPIFFKDILNFVKDVPNFIKYLPNFIKDVPRGQSSFQIGERPLITS